MSRVIFLVLLVCVSYVAMCIYCGLLINSMRSIFVLNATDQATTRSQ